MDIEIGGAMWRVIAASLASRDHIAAAAPNQDAFRVRRLQWMSGETCLGFAIADGVTADARGSEAAEVGVGSAMAALEAIVSTSRRPPAIQEYGPIGRTVLDRTRGRLADMVRLLEASPGMRLRELSESSPSTSGYGSTLACFLLTPPVLMVASIGSTIAVARVSEKDFHLVLPPWGPDGTLETDVFWASRGASNLARCYAYWEPRLTGLLVGSDGLAGRLLNPDRDAFWPLRAQDQADSEDPVRSLFSMLGDPATPLGESQVLRSITEDDVTAIAIGRTGQA